MNPKIAGFNSGITADVISPKEMLRLNSQSPKQTQAKGQASIKLRGKTLALLAGLAGGTFKAFEIKDKTEKVVAILQNSEGMKAAIDAANCGDESKFAQSLIGLADPRRESVYEELVKVDPRAAFTFRTVVASQLQKIGIDIDSSK